MVEQSKLGLFSVAGFSIVLCQVYQYTSIPVYQSGTPVTTSKIIFPPPLLFQVISEVAKQISNYSIQVFNGGKYPLPQTMIVVLIELIKLVVTVIRSGCQRPSFDPVTLRHSMKFLLPSLLYASE